MAKQKVVKLKPKDDIILATCMNCHGTHWYLHLDKSGSEFTRLIKIQCSNPDCGMFIKSDIPLVFKA